MARYTFRSEGLPCQGQIVGKVGDTLLVEGLAQDSGSYFLKLNDEMRRFASRKEAEDYGAEIAQDAQKLSFEDWMKEVDRAVRAKVGMSYQDLDDYMYRDEYDRGTSPAVTAARAIKYSGGDAYDISIAMDPLTAKGEKIKDAMEDTYGSKKKADQVFYASANAGKIKGAHD